MENGHTYEWKQLSPLVKNPTKWEKRMKCQVGQPWSIGGPWSSFAEKWPGAKCVGKRIAGVARVAGTIHRRDE